MYLKRGRLANFMIPPSNPNASIGARELYARIQNCYGSPSGSERAFFTGVNETGAATPYFAVNGNRFQALTGKRPLFRPVFYVGPSNPAYSAMVQAVKDHHRAGGICGTIWHPKNYITGGNNYDRSKGDWDAVLACMSPGGSKLAEYRADLDDFIHFCKVDCVDDDGVPIPMLVRTANEANGWNDYPDMSVTSLTRSGTTATMHFSRGVEAISSKWANKELFQIRGASDTKWNKGFTPLTYVQDGDNNGGTVTFTVTDSPTSSPSGTITAYPSAGDWWAGADRAPDFLTLVRQTIDYVRDVGGCNNLLWGPALFTWNRVYLSTNPATYPYSIWLTGMENYWDFIGCNLYQDEPVSWGYCDFGNVNVVNGFQPFVDWCNQYQRPIFLYEFGARYDGATTADFWTRRCFDALQAKFPRLAGAAHWSPTWMPTDGTPAVADFQAAHANQRHRFL